MSTSTDEAAEGAQSILPAMDWFASRGWNVFAFQQEVWQGYLRGESGLVHAPTGMGKTYAVALGPMIEAANERKSKKVSRTHGGARRERSGVVLLWVTPLRALAADTVCALQDACDGLGLGWKVQMRTGDTSASIKKRQKEQGLPEVLVTTPESISVMLADSAFVDGGGFGDLRCIVVDEWHELMGTKRGVQTELVLARLRALAKDSPACENPRQVCTWGLSATLGNVQQAMNVLLGPGHDTDKSRLVRAHGAKVYEISTLLPPDIERFPWAGHLGLRLLEPVCDQIEQVWQARADEHGQLAHGGTTLVFTNTRSQAEIWFASIMRARPKWLGSMAIHHGSLDRELRAKVEQLIANGELRCCVCTSSLDLGVDFAPVAQVIQIGSPKGVGRLIQRAGRSGHVPGGVSRVVCVPTHALEIVEFAAVGSVIAGGDHASHMEVREPMRLALDVLVQHMLTLACGGGFDQQSLLQEVRQTYCFEQMTDQQWHWCMEYVTRGGPALAGYEHFARTKIDESSGRIVIASKALSRAHKLSIGTIMSDSAIAVRVGSSMGGKHLGTVEESFISRLKPGDVFTFSGRTLELVRVREMTAFTKVATKRGNVPSWQGARMPLSSMLSAKVRELFGQAQRGEYLSREMQAVAALLELQKRISRLPVPDKCVIELCQTSERGVFSAHAFVYAMGGRLVHEGLGAILAHRLGKRKPRTFTIASQDHGVHVQTDDPLEREPEVWREVLSPTNLLSDVLECLNSSLLARRAFREIARVSGLVSQGFPGQPKSTRHLQANSELMFDVLTEFDPQNLLLDQARREVLERQLEFSRLEGMLKEIQGQELEIVVTGGLTPMGFPLWVDTLRDQSSSEKWTDRVQRMLKKLEAQC